MMEQRKLFVKRDGKSLKDNLLALKQQFNSLNFFTKEVSDDVVEVVLQDNTLEHLSAAEAILRNNLPSNSFTNPLKPNSSEALQEFENYAKTKSHVQGSVDIIKKAFELYGTEKICVSFNGGKDCTALLHLVYCIFQKEYQSIAKDKRLTMFYISFPENFSEMEEFVSMSCSRYNLKKIVFSCQSYKEALIKLRESTDIRAIFMGTRQSDSNYTRNLQSFQVTDNGFAEFMRIHPMLNWTYSQVWSYLRDLNIPYCSLYDQG